MQLTDFLDGENNLTISGLTADSRQVKKGYLFAALPGNKADGNKYIEDAIHHGADFILTSKEQSISIDSSKNIVFIKSDNTRRDFAKIAARFYKLQPENIVAVTGTSGKTSTVAFVQQLWHLSGIDKCASLGTLGLRGPKMRKKGNLTTPDSQTLHATLADLKAVGIDHLAMEASSHGLDQYRLDGVKVKIAAYTNLSRDHLDYHPTMDDYFAAKARLFSEVMVENGRAILNADDDYFSQLVDICKKRGHEILSFGKNGEYIKILSVKAQPKGQKVKLSLKGHDYEVTLPLVGDFQIMNAVCALALTLPFVDDVTNHVKLIEKLRGVPGRLQLIEGHPKGAVYVDYAHKPAALEIVLNTLRKHTKNRLICVFGCGGNRDRGKRKIMGEISQNLADVTYVTDDNPRYEDAQLIRQQVLEGVPSGIEIGDRAEAIKVAIQDLQEGDVLVVAGKGHEEGQIIQDQVHPFNDTEIIAQTITEMRK